MIKWGGEKIVQSEHELPCLVLATPDPSGTPHSIFIPSSSLSRPRSGPSPLRSPDAPQAVWHCPHQARKRGLTPRSPVPRPAAGFAVAAVLMVTAGAVLSRLDAVQA